MNTNSTQQTQPAGKSRFLTDIRRKTTGATGDAAQTARQNTQVMRAPAGRTRPIQPGAIDTILAPAKKPAPAGGRPTGGQGGQNRRPGGNGNGGGGNRRGGGGQGGRAGGGRRPKGVDKDIARNWKKPGEHGGTGMPSPAGTAKILKPMESDGKTKLRVIVVGGAEEVGRNMTLIEYGEDIILIDCGLQFPEEEMPGIDYVIPNVSYLKGKEKNIRGIIITHGHYDHIGAIPHLAPLLHNPPIFSAPLSLGLIAKRQDDFAHTPKLDLRQVDIDGQLHLGNLIVEFVRINHSIPDSLAIVVRTPEGTILHTGDFKFDLQPIGDQVTDFAKLTRLGQEGILALLGDSTNASKPGQQISESTIGQNIEDIMSKAKGRIIVGTFASSLNRVQQLLWSAEKLGRKVVLEGFSMKTNVEIAKQLGYLTVKNDTIIKAEDAERLSPEKLLIVGTGAQGEENASMMRIAQGEHRFFKVHAGDMVIFSSSVVPGNERSVQSLKDLLIRQGATVIHYQMMDVHAGGHAQKEDIKLLLRMVNPKYYVPVEGNLHLLHDNGLVARELGWTEDKVFITSNGQVMEFMNGEGRLTDEKIVSDYVFVDGLGVGDISEVVLRDRQLLSEDGMLVVIMTLDAKSGKVIGTPDIISRGFVYAKSSTQLMDDARKKVVDIVSPHLQNETPNAAYIKNKLRDDLGMFLFERTQRKPMILPVIIEV